jgi:hypothetical protein
MLKHTFYFLCSGTEGSRMRRTLIAMTTPHNAMLFSWLAYQTVVGHVSYSVLTGFRMDW